MPRLAQPPTAFGTLALALSLWLAQPIAGEEVRAFPQAGGAVVYTDIDARGRLLEIDYGRRSARELGRFEVSSEDPPLLVQGWVLGDGEQAVLLLLEPTQDPGWHGRLHLYSQGSPRLQATSVRLDLTAGDFAFLPLSEELAFVEYRDTRSGHITRLVLDVSRNMVRGGFDFPLADDVLHSWPGEGRYLYLARPLEPGLRKVDLEARQATEVTDLSSLLPAEEQTTFAFVGALSDQYALVNRKYLEADQIQLFLVDLDRLEVVAASPQLPFFTGRFRLEPQQDGVRIACTVERVVQGHYQATGRIRQFVRRGREIQPVGEVRFDPEVQIALRDRSGSYQVFDRVRFDYVSLLEVERRVLQSLPGAYPESVGSGAAKWFAQAVEELRHNDVPHRPLRKLRIED